MIDYNNHTRTTRKTEYVAPEITIVEHTVGTGILENSSFTMNDKVVPGQLSDDAFFEEGEDTTTTFGWGQWLNW